MSPGELVNIVEFKTLGLLPGATQQPGDLKIIDGQRYQVRPRAWSLRTARLQAIAKQPGPSGGCGWICRHWCIRHQRSAIAYCHSRVTKPEVVHSLVVTWTRGAILAEELLNCECPDDEHTVPTFQHVCHPCGTDVAMPAP